MAQNTITFEIGGQVDIKQLEKGFTAIRRLIVSLTGRAKVEWVVEDLQAGSAITTLRGEGDKPAVTEQIVSEYEKFGKALQNKEDIPGINKSQLNAVNAVKKLAASVDYLRLETQESNFFVYGNGNVPAKPATTVAIGAVTGRVQVLSNRGRLRFNLYDTIHDKAISCYLRQGQEDLMREAWGQRAMVSGQVTREADTGRPITVRQILDVEILKDAPPRSYLEARGAVPWRPGDMLPEDVIRELRDA